MLPIGLVARLVRPRAAKAPSPQGRVVEGEYVVVDGTTVDRPAIEDAR